MDYKKIGAGLAVFAVVALTGSAIVSAASPASLENSFKGFGHKNNNEHRAEIDTAISSGDYQTFKLLIGDNNKMFEKITAENFDQFVQMHNLMKEGNYTEAKVIAEELGLGVGRGMFGERGAKGFNHGVRGPNFVDSNGDGLCDNADVK